MFSQQKVLGLALSTQEQQKKIFIKSILWILSFLLTLLSIPSFYGILRLINDFKQKNKDYVSCRDYFIHAFHSCVMGYMDLCMHIANFFVQIFVLLAKLVMTLFPWRKGILQELTNAIPQDSPHKFQKDYYQIMQACQTLLDIPFIVLSGGIFFIGPLRIRQTIRCYKEKPADQWRIMIIKQYFNAYIDIPFVLMLYFIFMTVVLAFKFKKRLHLKATEQNKTLEEIIRHEISQSFTELVLVYIIWNLIFIFLSLLFILTALFVPWRMRLNVFKFRQLVQQIKIEYGNDQNIIDIFNMLCRNFMDIFFDCSLMLFLIVSLASKLFTFWRIISHQQWVTQTLILSVKQNFELRQHIILKDIIVRTALNIKYFMIDLPQVLIISLNIFGFQRYFLIYRRFKLKKLTKQDLLINPFNMIFDFPWLFLCTVLIILSPWRFIVTFWNLISNDENFFNDEINFEFDYSIVLSSLKHGLLDYIMLPPYLIALINPYHWKIVLWDLILKPKKIIDYKNIEELNVYESQRNKLVLMLCEKNVHYAWQFIILLPLNLVCLYYIPLLRHLVKSQPDFIKNDAKREQFFQKNDKLIQASKFFQIQDLTADYYFPKGTSQCILIVNRQFLKQIYLFPLLWIMIILNPYRAYQFLMLSNHTFVSGFAINSLNDLELQETLKRKNIIVLFKESLTDYFCLLFGLVIMLTGFRSFYLIAILSVNGHLTRFNPFLQKLTNNSTILMLKLQQIEKVMKDDNNQQRKKKFLSFKHCVWIATVEWLLDLLIIPIVIPYIIFLPWRFNELKNLVALQITEVPSNSQNINKLKHILRNLYRKQLPNRFRVIYDFFRFLVKDYLTILITVVLICTVWRTINTLEIIYDYSQHFKKDDKFLLADYKLKDISIQKRLAKEFRNLLRDFVIFFFFIFSLLLVHRANILLMRLKGVYNKKNQRKELQTLEYIKLLRIFKSAKKDELQPLDQKQHKMRIVNLNKNVMSITLPFLKHDELLKVEQANKQMAVFVNHWPVWRNIYYDQHLANQKIPLEIKRMNQSEQECNEYRQVCKRCFIYQKKNQSDEDHIYPEDIADYLKGEVKIIMEEFTLSIIDFPRFLAKYTCLPFHYIFKFTSQLTDSLCNLVQSLQIFQSTYVQQRISLFTVLLKINRSTSSDNYERVLGEDSMTDPRISTLVYLIKTYVDLISIFKNITICLFLNIIVLLSAGPVGNLISRQAPPANSASYKYCDWIFYMFQTLLFIPMLSLWFWPILTIIYVLDQQIQDSIQFNDIFNARSFLQFVLVGLILIDIIISHVEVYESFRGRNCFPFIDPLEFFRIAKRSIYAVARFIIIMLKYAFKILKQIFTVIFSWIVRALKIIGNILEVIWIIIQRAAMAIFEIFSLILEIIFKAASYVVMIFKQFLESEPSRFSKMVTQFVKSVIEVLKMIIVVIFEAVKNGLIALLKIIKIIGEKISQALLSIIEAVYKALVIVWNFVSNLVIKISLIVYKILSFIIDKQSKVIYKSVSFIYDIIVFIFDKIIKTLTYVGKTIFDVLAFLFKKLYNFLSKIAIVVYQILARIFIFIKKIIIFVGTTAFKILSYVFEKIVKLFTDLAIAIYKVLVFIWEKLSKIITLIFLSVYRVLGIVWIKISSSVKMIALFVYRVVKAFLVALWKIIVVISVQLLKKTVSTVNLVYFLPFSFLFTAVKPLGIFGELIFTIFGLFWLLWPLYGTYILINDMEFPKELWLGGIILTVLLIVLGRKIILKGGKISN